VDRCALFVDASYVLADGAMAVHGTRRGESVSWDYEGLLQLLSGLARERTGLPLLRCYWYEATVDGRRTAEQDTLADIPGIKLRVAKIRPGRREGVETEIHRDLTTLARNSAVSDALVLSAEEDLAQVFADVQDLGMRVTLVHIAVDGNWTISRSLRQESDDIIEIGGEQLRPYVELIVGAEPAHADEPDDADHAPGRPAANGHSAVAGAGSYQPPAIYTAPVVAEYQRPAPQPPRATARDTREERARDAREERARDAREERAREDRGARETREDRGARETVNGEAQPSRPDIYVAPAPRTRQERQDRQDRQERPEPVPARVARVPEDITGYAGSQGSLDGLTGTEATQAPSGQLRRLPARHSGPLGPVSSSPPGQHAGQGSARSAPYSGPQPVMTSPPPGYPSGGGVSLAEAVQAAHEEGQEFGASVARDAPALWLEAVLARKPRMPSDLEARLLQGSALPIDFLLHDEVRHALRRGFWDALERTRR
jgi:NYN domain